MSSPNTYRVKLSDGRVVRVKAASEAAAREHVMQNINSLPEPSPAKAPAGSGDKYGNRYVGAFMDGVDSLADGMTFGLAPYIRGAARSGLEGSPLGEGVATERADQERRRTERPVATFINEAGGGMMTGGGLANAGVTATRFVPQTAGLGARSAAIGTDAAVMGGISAAAEGQNPGLGALMGFGLGAGANAGLDKVGGAVARGLRQRQVTRAAPNTQDIRAAQKAAYGAFDSEDIAISRGAGGRLVEDVNERLAKLALSRRQNSNAYGYIDDIAEHVNRADGVSMKTLENIRSNIGADLRGNVKGSERKALREVSSAIDAFFDGAKDSDVVAGGNKTRAYNALREARAQTKRLKKADILDEVFLKADGGYASGDANGVRLGIRAILKNPKKRSQFTSEELSAMKRVADGGAVEILLRQIGRLGPVLDGGGSNSLGAMIGMGGGAAAGSTLGPGGAAVGAIALPAAGAAARTASDAATMRNARYLQALTNMTGRTPAPTPLQKTLTDDKARAVTADALLGGLFAAN